MGATSEDRPERQVNVGLLAHVDAGKTTLSEGLLYAGGMIKERGRVDKQSAYLDTDALERERGITIFSKQAILKLKGLTVALLDTPGHVDFSAEAERALPALDYAVLVINGADGVQGHTKTLWQLLGEYQIPVFCFVNKMDQPQTDEARLMEELKKQLSGSCISFQDTEKESFFEEIAMCGEEALEEFLETDMVCTKRIQKMILKREVFPCYFGSALKYTGVEELLHGICAYAAEKTYPREFGAKVYKIARDEAGTRLTYLKITGGSLKVRATVKDAKENWEEKVSQLRIYSGEKYEAVSEAFPGELCAAVGLTKTYAGEGLGIEKDSFPPLLAPVLTYRILLPDGCDATQFFSKIRQLEEEDPRLHLLFRKQYQEILVQVMGEVQLQVLKRRILDRFGVEIEFGAGHIIYQETIAEPVVGAGHFEPLRHYAEVQLLLEPLTRGSGLVFETACSEDVLGRNWQRLALSHLREKEHIGVLTGSAITDMKITLIAGKSHPKHTEGGDFRQAVYRAVRQGLRQAKSVLLEPYYEYRLEVPAEMAGRAMTDLKLRQASIEGPEIWDGAALLMGKAPVALLQEYAKEVAAYAKGAGRLSLSYGGYGLCHNAEEVINEIGYDVDADLENTASSVFCTHGAGYIVEWDRVPEMMSVIPLCHDGVVQENFGEEEQTASFSERSASEEDWISPEEVDAILKRTFGANKKNAAQKKNNQSGRRIEAKEEILRGKRPVKEPEREEYLLVDGYNIIYAWEDLRELSKTNMDGARGRLLDLLCNYQGMKKCRLIAVFDAYRVSGHTTEHFDYHNIHVVFTKEAETADAYIEKFAHDNGKKYRVTVATSDGLEQIIIRGEGCRLLSANDLAEEMRMLTQDMREAQQKAAGRGRTYLMDGVSKEVRQLVRAAVSEEESI